MTNQAVYICQPVRQTTVVVDAGDNFEGRQRISHHRPPDVQGRAVPAVENVLGAGYLRPKAAAKKADDHTGVVDARYV